MATRTLTRWHVSRFPAAANHGPYAYVQLHGKESHGLLGGKYSLVSEAFRVPLEPGAKDDHKANQALVKKAMEMSSNKWTGRIP
jgi:hypothetical protein